MWAAAYLPFGKAQVKPEIVTNNLRFPGQYFDVESGLHYNWNRYYDPETGRYLTADPIGLDGGVNLYVYVMNNPMIWIDPAGLEIRLYSSDAFGVPGLNHAFVYSTELGRGKGTNGSSGLTLGDGVGDIKKSPYVVVPLPPGMPESDFMRKFVNAKGWNNLIWIPWINDCHTDAKNGFDNAGVPYPGAPNGRVDFDDNRTSYDTPPNPYAPPDRGAPFYPFVIQLGR